jgi:DNA topoisomerase-1
LAKEADVFVNACDFDIEGSLIGYSILRYACAGADRFAKRMKFSTLTAEELRQAYDDMLPKLDFSIVNAGLCRHEVDWLYGINLSRALTESARKSSGKYMTLSTGRVQGPTLRFIAEREQEIQSFVPVPYWQVQATVEISGQTLQAEPEVDRFDIRAEAERVASLSDRKDGVVEEVESKATQVAPPFPFDLSSLQAEAYRHFRMAPRSSLSIAERLYLDALISYPRTSSQKLPVSIETRHVLELLSKNPRYQRHADALLALRELRPNEGKKVDPAHPAVYPTGTLAKRSLEPKESKIYDLVVKRFMATHGPPATRASLKATIAVNGLRFHVRGSRMTVPGWIDFYKPYARFEDVNLPAVSKGAHVKFLSVKAVEKFSQPPPRYNPSSLLHEMETVEIGTKATRAEIVETLFRRGYMNGDKIKATPLGIQIVEVLEKYCPRVLNVALTRELEEMMSNIEVEREERQHVVDEAVRHLKPIMEQLKSHEREVGEQLSRTAKGARTAKTTLSVPCPKCGRDLHVIRSRKSGKRFIGCMGKWEKACSFTLPLPQLGLLTLLDEKCNKCGFQLVKVASRGRRTFTTCPMCYIER